MGSKNEVCVVDEGCFGSNSGVNKGPQQPHGRSDKDRIAKKYPAQTLWKEGAKVTRAWKKKGNGRKAVVKKVKKTKADKRRCGNWIWAVVECGKYKKTPKTHGAGTKRSVFELLSKSTLAEDAKPRGYKELVKQFAKHVRKGSFIVADKWKATKKAVQELGYSMPPEMVNHSKWFRDPATGYHTNDAESEINRLKSWMRKKYGRVQTRGSGDEEPDRILTAHLDEFMVLKNVGNAMSTIMRAFSFVRGKAFRAVDI